MDQIIAWLEQHKISTHTIAVLWMGLLLYYQSNSDFHALVTGVYARIPKWVSTIALTAFSLYSWYRNGQKTNGNGSGPGPGILSIAGGTAAGLRPGAGGSGGGGGVKAARDTSRWAKWATAPIAAVLCLALIPFASGCHRNVNTNPQVVYANSLLAAANSTKLLADGLAAANDYAESVQQTEPDYYVKLHAWILKIRDANDKAISAIGAAEAGDQAADWRGAMVGILTAAGKDDLTVFGFKNPDSQQAARIALDFLTKTIAGIGKDFGGA
jgi:hypothetical protein